MKQSKLSQETDAIVFIVMSCAILAVSAILLAFPGTVPPLGIAFAFFAGMAAFFGLLINALNLVLLYMGKHPMTLGNDDNEFESVRK